jgi:hypothetical protein
LILLMLKTILAAKIEIIFDNSKSFAVKFVSSRIKH